MKNIFILFVFIFPFILQAQEYELSVVKNGNNLEYYLTALDVTGVNGSGMNTTDFTFTIEYPTSAGVDISLPVTSTLITKAGGIEEIGSNTRQGYQIANVNGVPMVSLSLNTPVLIGVQPINVATPGSSTVNILPEGILFGQPNIQYDAVFDYTPLVGAAAPLPIKLSKFAAVKWDDHSALLTWTSESEINASHFAIERSTNHSDWEQIGTVKAAGESTTTKSYEFVDENVGMLRSDAVFYYRLRMVDLDNTFEYSDVRSVAFNANTVSVLTYPNPAKDLLKVDIIIPEAYKSSPAQVTIFDNTGKRLYHNTNVAGGILEVPGHNLHLGVNLVQVVVGDQVINNKVIKVD